MGSRLACLDVCAHEDSGHQGHAVLFYRDDEEVADRVSAFLRPAIEGHGLAIVISGDEHRKLVRSTLASGGLDMMAASAAGSYLALDANDTLRRFLVAGWPDLGGFWRTITPLIEPVQTGGRPVAIFNETVARLWQAELVSAAVEAEAMWNEVACQNPVTVLCGYPATLVADTYHAAAVAQVRRLHGLGR